MTSLDIFTDGACSGNPGPAVSAFIIKHNGRILKDGAVDIGSATNNIAEYRAVIYALQEALTLKADEIRVHTDSELLYKQLCGAYRIRNANIKPLWHQIKHLLGGFPLAQFRQIPREDNKDADGLAKKFLKKLLESRQAGTVASVSFRCGTLLTHDTGEESPSSLG